MSNTEYMSKYDTLHTGADGVDREATVYSMGTHDIWQIDGLFFVGSIHRKHLGVLISDWTPEHYSIMEHFRLYPHSSQIRANATAE